MIADMYGAQLAMLVGLPPGTDLIDVLRVAGAEFNALRLLYNDACNNIERLQSDLEQAAILSSANDNLKSENALLKEKLLERERDIAAKNERLLESITNSKVLEARLAFFDDERKRLEDTNKVVVELAGDLETSKARVLDLELVNGQLAALARSSNEELQMAKKEWSSVLAEMTAITTQLRDTEQARGALEKWKTDAEAESKEMRDALQRQEEELKHMHMVLEQQYEELQVERAKNEQLGKGLEEAIVTVAYHAKMKAALEELVAIDEQTAKLQQQEEKKRYRVEDLEMELERVRARCEEAETKLAEVTSQGRQAAIDNEMALLHAQLSEGRANELEKSLVIVKEELKESRKECVVLSEEITRYRHGGLERNVLQMELINALRDEIDLLHRTVADAKSSIAELEQENKAKTETVDHMQSVLTAMTQAQLEKQQGDLDAIQSQTEKYKAESLQAQLDKHQTDLSIIELQSELTVSLNKATEWEMRYEAVCSERDDALVEISDLTKQLTATMEAAQCTEAKYSDLLTQHKCEDVLAQHKCEDIRDAELATLRMNLIATTEMADQLADQVLMIPMLQRILSQYATAIDQANREAITCEHHMQTLAVRIGVAAEQVNTRILEQKNREIEELRTMYEQLEESSNRTVEQKQELQHAYDKLVEQKKELEETKGEAKNRVHHLENEMNLSVQEIATLQRVRDQYESELSVVKAQWAEHNDTYSACIQALLELLQQCILIDADSLEGLQDKWVQQHLSKQIQVERAKKELGSAWTLLSEAVNKTQRTTEEMLTQTSDQIGQLQQAAAADSREKVQLMAERDALTEERDALMTERDKLSSQLLDCEHRNIATLLTSSIFQNALDPFVSKTNENSKITDASMELEEALVRASKAEDEVRRLKEENKEMMANSSAASEKEMQIVGLEHRILDILQQLEEENAMMATLKEELDNMKTRLVEKDTRIEELELQHELIGKQLQVANDGYRSLQGQHAAEMRQKEEQISSLQEIVEQGKQKTVEEKVAKFEEILQSRSS